MEGNKKFFQGKNYSTPLQNTNNNFFQIQYLKTNLIATHLAKNVSTHPDTNILNHTNHKKKN